MPPLPPLPNPSDRTRRDADDIRRIALEGAGRLLYVAAIANGLVTLREADGTLLPEPLAFVGAVPLQIDDAVVRLPIPGRGTKHAKGSFVAIGPIKRKPNDASLAENAISATNATVATNASTSVFQSAGALSLTLGPGKWEITAEASLAMIHSGSGKSDFRITIDGSATQRQSPALSASVYGRYEVSQRVEGVIGNRDVVIGLDYKSFGTGTTSAANPSIKARAMRTK